MVGFFKKKKKEKGKKEKKIMIEKKISTQKNIGIQSHPLKVNAEKFSTDRRKCFFHRDVRFH